MFVNLTDPRRFLDSLYRTEDFIHSFETYNILVNVNINKNFNENMFKIFK